MKVFKRILSWLFAALALLIVIDAAAVFTIVVWPDSAAGKWLAQYEPLFQLLQKSTLKSEYPDEIPDEPVVQPPRVIRVPGPTYVYVAPGLEIYERPEFSSPIIAYNEDWIRLRAIRDDEDWALLPFIFGEGWVFTGTRASSRHAKMKRTERRISQPAGGGQPSSKEFGGNLVIEIRVEPDYGRRPDAVYFDHPQRLPRPLLFAELTEDSNPVDLVAIPNGLTPERLQLATMLVGGNAPQEEVGDFVLRYQEKDKNWSEMAKSTLLSLKQTYLETFESLALREPLNNRVFIFLLPNLDAYKKFYPDAKTKDEMQTAGHYEAGIIAVYSDPAMRGETRRTLTHEAVHHLNHTLLALQTTPATIWLDEGLATYFGLSARDADGKLILGKVEQKFKQAGLDTISAARRLRITTSAARYRILLLQRELKSGFKISLKDMIDARESKFHSSNVLRDYTVAWMTVHYLVHGNDGAYRQGFLQFIEKARKGEADAGTFERNVGAPIKRIESELRHYIIRQ